MGEPKYIVLLIYSVPYAKLAWNFRSFLVLGNLRFGTFSKVDHEAERFALRDVDLEDFHSFPGSPRGCHKG